MLDDSDVNVVAGPGHYQSSVMTVYKRRWYILTIFSLHAMFQCTVWNTWGPVDTVALSVFHTWTTADISNFANWGNYVLVPFFIPCMMIVNKSIRIAVLLGTLSFVIAKYTFQFSIN